MTGPGRARERWSGWIFALGTVAFVAQSLLGPVFTLCVDADGAVHVEFAASGCCETGAMDSASRAASATIALPTSTRRAFDEPIRIGDCRHAGQYGGPKRGGVDVEEILPGVSPAVENSASQGAHCESCFDVGLAEILRGLGLSRSHTVPPLTVLAGVAHRPAIPDATELHGPPYPVPATESPGSAWPSGFAIPMTC